jgi:hypothetical protein
VELRRIVCRVVMMVNLSAPTPLAISLGMDREQGLRQLDGTSISAKVTL